MVILLIVFGVAFQIHVQVMSSGSSQLQTEAQLNIRHQAELTRRNQKYIDEVISMNGYDIIKEVESLDETLVHVRLKAVRPNGDLLCERKEVMLVRQ